VVNFPTTLALSAAKKTLLALAATQRRSNDSILLHPDSDFASRSPVAILAALSDSCSLNSDFHFGVALYRKRYSDSAAAARAAELVPDSDSGFRYPCPWPKERLRLAVALAVAAVSAG
jgi:hypothetical protein